MNVMLRGEVHSTTLTGQIADYSGVLSAVNDVNTEFAAIKNSSVMYKGVLSTGTDLDSVKTNGIYYVGSGSYSHKPGASSTYGFLNTIAYGNNITQMFIATGSVIYTRRATNSATSWSDWVRMATKDQVDTLSDTVTANQTSLTAQITAVDTKADTNSAGIAALNTNLTKSNAFDRARMSKNLIEAYIPTIPNTKNGYVWALNSDGYTVTIKSDRATATSTSKSFMNASIATLGVAVGDVLYAECYSGSANNVYMQIRFRKSDNSNIKVYDVKNAVVRMVVPANTANVYAILYDKDHTEVAALDDSMYGIGLYKDTASPSMAMNAVKRVESLEDQHAALYAIANPFKDKVWCHFGDSFSKKSNVTIASGRYAGKKKTYPYIIANRLDMDLKDVFFESGRTLAYPEVPGGFTNAITCPTVEWYYQNMPEDVDYITIQIGINDEHHSSADSAGDGEDNTGVIPIGTISDTTVYTYYGAWNVLLTWIRTNRPFAHVGMIVTNGTTSTNYRNAQIAIAKKYGIAYIDLNGDERTPAMIRPCSTDISAEVKNLLKQKFALNYAGGDLHPGEKAHEYQAVFIENFLRTI